VHIFHRLLSGLEVFAIGCLPEAGRQCISTI